MIAAQTDYQHTAIDRAVDGILTVEDVIIHKLIAWRARDRDDIAQILDARHVLDWGTSRSGRGPGRSRIAG